MLGLVCWPRLHAEDGRRIAARAASLHPYIGDEALPLGSARDDEKLVFGLASPGSSVCWRVCTRFHHIAYCGGGAGGY
jgi:hypothetical protein